VINQVIQPLLNGIQSIRTGVQGLYEQQIWPQSMIGGAESWFGTIAGLFYQPFETDFLLPVNSATLATPQAFEQALLSRSSGSIGSLGSLYTQLYGPVPPTTQASASARMRMDIDDAMAQDGMKQSLLWDQAQSGNDQAAAAIEGLGAFEAPGSAPFHTAAGASAQLRAALLQLRIVSAMLRQEAAKLAEENMPRKESARQTQRLQNDITAAMP
jgi:hypothetical protein